MTAEEDWRGQLVALGYVTELGMWDDAHVEHDIGTWEDVLILLAQREARNDTDAAKIITGLLALLQVEYDKVNDADGRAMAADRRTSEVQAELTQMTAYRDKSASRLRMAERERDDLKQASRTTENAALVGHQVGAFIDAGRKMIKVTELDLPAEWGGDDE